MKRIFGFLLISTLFVCISCDNDDDVSVELPAIVQSFLDTNYPNHEVEEAELKTLCTGEEVYEIELENSDDEEFEIAVDLEGVLVFTESEISNSELPAEVSSSLADNYAEYSIDEAERLDMADGSIRYEAEIKNGNSALEILLETDGTVVCETVAEDD